MSAMAQYIVFDTLKYVETLTASGIPSIQAKALSLAHKEAFQEVLENNTHVVATKADIQELKAEIQELRQEFKTDLDVFKLEVRTEIAQLKRDIAKLQIEMIYMRWMLGILILGIGSLVAKAFL